MTIMEKNFASLTAGLLARKGQARPAIRHAPTAVDLAPQSVWAGQTPSASRLAPAPTADRIDVGTAPDLPAPRSSAEPEPAIEPAAAEASAPRAPEPAGPRDEQAPPVGGRSAFTLRLDPDRHLKLRLACAHRNISAQQMVTAALDAWLAEHAPALPDRACPCREIGVPDLRSPL